MSTETTLIETLQITTYLLKNNFNSDTTDKDWYTQNNPDSDTTNKDWCLQSNSDADTTKKDWCLQKQLWFIYYK
jgi:hypothetical protein